MKKLLQFFFILVLSINSFSQGMPEKITAILNEAGKDIPSDQLFLHLDRNLYHPKDTIRFQAYIRDSRTGVFGTESSSLYALLINSSHETIDSARFRIIYLSVPGWLDIPESILPGDYSVLAFTSSDMNFSPKYAFSTPVRIDNLVPSHKESVKNAKNQDAPGYQSPVQDQTIDLRFLPEGGTFIYGIKQRLAFNAVTSSGKGLEISGEIIDHKDVKIREFRSTPYGPGVIEFTPVQGEIYFATLKGEEFKGMKWPLPVPQQSGVAIRADITGEGLIDIVLRGRQTKGSNYFMTITMNNVLVFSENVKIDTLYRKKFRTDKLPSGTAYISVYDNELNPVAERLVFLNDYKKMNVKIGLSAPFFFKGDETELTVTTADEDGEAISSIVSVAVIDSVSGYCNAIPPSEIESSYLYDKGFYDNLPLRIKSGGLKRIDTESMDMLLMTYGWRRFIPKEVLQSPERELINYDYLTINNPGPLRKGRSDINLISDASLDVIALQVNNKREAVLYYDSLDVNVRQVMILPDKVANKNLNPVRITFPENKDYTDRAKLLANYPARIIPDLPFIAGMQPEINLDGYTMIEPVTIKAPPQPVKPKAYVDRHAKMYQSTGATTWYSKDFGAAYTLDDILYKYNPFRLVQFSWEKNSDNYQIFLSNRNQYIKSSPGTDKDGKPIIIAENITTPALIVLDNSAIGFTYESIAQMPASNIVSVTFLKGVQGVPMYGTKANGGVVFVTTRIGSGYTEEELDKMNEVRRNDDLLQQVRLFRTETEFYTPAKEEVANNPEYRFRSTILWQDNVFIDESGTVKIRYPNNMVKGTAMVVVNGVSSTNLIGSDKFSYEVK